MVGFDTDTSDCLRNRHAPWKVCCNISQPTCLVRVPVAHWGDVPEGTRLVQPFIRIGSKAGTATACHSPVNVGWQKAPLQQEWTEDNLQCLRFIPNQSPAGSQNQHICISAAHSHSCCCA